MTGPDSVARIADFHGHMCPGLAMGIRAAEVCLAEIGAHSSDEEILAVVETDMCAVDAIQFLTGCTFGKGNLVHRDYGKNAYTFVRRADRRAVRVSARPGSWSGRDPERETLRANVRAGTATDEERNHFAALQQEHSERLLAAPLAELYDVREVQADVRPRARIVASVDCAGCGEPTMETRIRRFEGRELCPPCFASAVPG